MLTLVTGIPKKAGVPAISVAPTVLATYGAQVLRPGATATESLPDQQLGLAIVIPDRDTSGVPEDEAANHLAAVKLTNGRGRYYVTAAWDQEGTERLVTFATGGQRNQSGSRVLPADGLTTREQFAAYVAERADGHSAAGAPRHPLDLTGAAVRAA